MTDGPSVRQLDGPRGGEYYVVDLSDGRILTVSRKLDDQRVWLGTPDDPKSFAQQRGGIGNIDKLLGEWFARVALDDEAAELYWALNALASRKRT